MTQYSSKEKTPVAKIQAADSASEKKIDRRIRKLIDQVEEQQKVIVHSTPL